MKDFQELLTKAKKRGKKCCVVACAEDFPTIEALHYAQKENIATGVLFGDRMRIEKIAESLKIPLTDFVIHHAGSEAEAVSGAIDFVKQNGDFLMKGQINTANFLKGILDEKHGLRGERILSHVALLSLPSYHKVLFISDGGMNTDLDLRRKIDIVKNAIELARFLGIGQPKVALLSAIERVNLNISETLDWAIITRMGEQGEFGDAIIEGPLALDIAFSTQSAQIKKVASRVSGDVDILIVPSIATGNILAKGLQYLGGAKICGIIVGAKRPVVMLSRADTPETKLFSIALGNLAA
jgi:phosphotransacetylase|uniref:Bifunctional enoyl-CoA hydratase/phosphate acetyltransferase n=1 Tax=candidate division WOR-3 bacterium TaxID=2052148 RepID=A0A7C6A8L1_UNCW3